MKKNEDFYYYSDEVSMEKDTDSFLKNMEEKTNFFDEEINIIYSSLNDIIKNLHEDYPTLDLTSMLIFYIRF